MVAMKCIEMYYLSTVITENNNNYPYQEEWMKGKGTEQDKEDNR